MSNVHTDENGFEYDGDLIDLIDEAEIEYDDLDDLVVIALTKAELEALGSFMASVITPATVPAVWQQVIDFAREATAGA